MLTSEVNLEKNQILKLQPLFLEQKRKDSVSYFFYFWFDFLNVSLQLIVTVTNYRERKDAGADFLVSFTFSQQKTNGSMKRSIQSLIIQPDAVNNIYNITLQNLLSGERWWWLEG